MPCRHPRAIHGRHPRQGARRRQPQSPRLHRLPHRPHHRPAHRDTFHSQVSNLGSYVEVARCSDCHGEHGILPASDPNSPVNSANLVKTCGRCHQNANAGFVKYEPHANPHNRHTSPLLYTIRLSMVLLISGVMTFFLLHSLLWLIRSLIERS